MSSPPSSPRKDSITIVKKKEKSSFGIPLSTIGKKQGAKLAASPRQKEQPLPPPPPRGEAQSLIYISPANSPPSSPRGVSPRGMSPRPASPAGPPLAPHHHGPRISELDEQSFHEFVAESMTKISSISDPNVRRSELAALQVTANEYTKRLVSEKERQEEERAQKAAEELRRKERKKKNVDETQLSRISEHDVLEYEKALIENKRMIQEEEKRLAMLRSRFCVGDIVYAGRDCFL